MNILIVNDSKLIDHILAQAFSTLAVNVVFCGSSGKALLQAQETRFDFIAISNNLMDGSGIELIDALRRFDGYHHLPIVLMTSQASPEMHLKALRAGATDIFLKQNIEELVTFVTRLINHEAHFDAYVLYIEDSPSQAKVMIRLLENHGLVVDWFPTAEEGLCAIQRQPYDLVLTDVVLNSTMQGTMFAMHIRRLSGTIGDIPILALTAYDKVDSRIALFQIGIDDYVSKPVVEEELLPRVFRLVERQRLMQSLRQQEKQAERYNEAKSAFLAHMSHEIRTPISAIVGATELLEKTVLDENQRHLVAIQKESSRSTLAILNDILDLSKIEAGRLEIEQIPMNLRDTIESAVQLVLPVAEKKNIALTLFFSPAMPVEIVSDPTRISQILLNLLSNAIKFTANEIDKPGTIDVRIMSVTTDNIPGVQLTVSDNGIGISEEVQNKLFQPFAQAEDSTYRKYGGTGLGLSIVKKLVDLMGGHIGLVSQLGRGSEFSVQFPLHVVEATSLHAAPLPLSNVRIAIISHHAECASVLLAYAQAAGAEATVHASFEALGLRIHDDQEWNPKVVVIDFNETRQVPAIPQDMRVVELIPRHQEKRIPRSIAVNCRPLFYHAYINAIAAACGIADVDDAMLSKDEKRLGAHRVLLAEDNELNQELFKAQFELIGVELVIAKDGVEALSLWRQQKFSLIMTDCGMPNMDGFELTQMIRTEESAQQRNIIVAITANALKGEAEHCLMSGMDDYIAKPVNLNDLQRLLNKWLGS